MYLDKVDLLIPTPQEIVGSRRDVALPLATLHLRLLSEHPLVDAAADVVARALGGGIQLPLDTAGPGITIGLAGAPELGRRLHVPEQAEGYTLRCDKEGIVIAGRDPAGCLHGARTLAQLLSIQWDNLYCPATTIQDWPLFAQRGLCLESFWGTDLMRLDDYRDLIERCGRLKLNTLIVGLFGGWEIKHHGKITEFLMIPLERHPELQTPQLLRYFEPATRQWVELRYLPRMAEEDLLSPVIRLAARHGIRVIPLWGGPAHVTLLPRLYPAVSAKDAAGRPLGYGYCMSAPATWELLFDILDEIAERYLLPNGLDMLHLGCDEIYPIRSVHEDDPLAEVNPWCQCPDCSRLSQAEQLTRYVLTLAGHLKARGIKTMIWQDTFARLDAMPTLWEGLVGAGLRDDVSMGWWCYKDPLPDFGKRPELPTWVQPAAGILPNLFAQDFSRNIYAMLRRGQEIHAVGATAYNIPDPAQHKNYHCLAQFAWSEGRNLPDFEIIYASAFYRWGAHDALEAYDAAQRVLGSYPLTVYILDQLLYYFNSYPYGVKDYPANVLADVVADPLALQTALRQAVALLESAKSLIERCRPRDRAGLIPQFVLECDRVISVTRGVLDTVTALAGYAEARARFSADRPAAAALLAQSAIRVRAVVEEILRVMSEIQRLKPAYVVPATLREVSYLASFLHELAGEMEGLVERERAGGLDELPQLAIVDKIGEPKLRAMWHPWEF